MFSGVYWNQPVCPSFRMSAGLCVCVSICVQNTSFCQSAGEVIKSHLVTALVCHRSANAFMSTVSPLVKC